MYDVSVLTDQTTAWNQNPLNDGLRSW
jgi:hypothetical protein